jgi:hypothetical protein
MKAFASGMLLWAASWPVPTPTVHSETLIMGYSGAGTATDLQRTRPQKRKTLG